LFEQLERTFRRHFYDDRDDALNRAHGIADERKRREATQQFGSANYVAEPQPELLEREE
jgi:DNA sulfur modification protein DndC